MSPLPKDVRLLLKSFGPSADLQVNKASKEAFVQLIEPGPAVRETFDVAYGDHPRQRLDIYRPIADGPAPIVLYVPGGGFTGGDKRQDEHFFGNLGRFFARNGVACLTMNYRLAPDFPWPSAAQDIQHVVRWIKANAGQWGGDGARLTVFGHSAGAAHVASYVFDPDLRGADEIAATVLSSGLYLLRASEMRPNVAQYFGTDATTFARRSAISHVAGSRIPVLLSVAAYDPTALATPTFDMAAELTRRDGHPPPILRLDDHNHFSYICGVGTRDTRFSAPLLDFVLRSGRDD